MGDVRHTPGPVAFTCHRCGWSGEVNGRPRCLPCHAKRSAAWRASNPEKKRELKRRADKKLRTERPELAAAKKRAKRQRNPDHYRAKYAERLAWLKQGDVTTEQLAILYGASGGVCRYCGKPAKARLSATGPRGFDHVRPRSKGGRHTINNMVVCCRPCNERRSDRG